MKPVKILFFAPYPLRFFRLVKALQLIPNVSCRVCYSLAEAVQAVLQWNPTVAVVASAIDFCMTPTGEENNKNTKVIKREGRVIEALPNAFFKVVLDDGNEILGFLSGKMRMNRITILPGDKVLVEMTPYDDKKGRIVYRLK